MFVDLFVVYFLRKCVPISAITHTSPFCENACFIMSFRRNSYTRFVQKARFLSVVISMLRERETLSFFFSTAESQRQLAKAIVASGRGCSADLSRELTRGRRPLSALCRCSGALCIFWAFRRRYGVGVV